MRSVFRRHRQRRDRVHCQIAHRMREHLARLARRERTTARLGVQLTHWGECPACGCIGAPNHRCGYGAGGVA